MDAALVELFKCTTDLTTVSPQKVYVGLNPAEERIFSFERFLEYSGQWTQIKKVFQKINGACTQILTATKINV